MKRAPTLILAGCGALLWAIPFAWMALASLRPEVSGAEDLASIAPSVAHQVELDLHGGADGFFVMEPPAFQIHKWDAVNGIVSHTA